MNQTTPTAEDTAIASAQATTTQVTADDVCRVAELANLELTADEIPAIERDLNAILGYIAQLNELDTTDVVPMAQVGELLTATSAFLIHHEPQRDALEGRSLRSDRVINSLERSQILAAAPESDGAFFKVPKVIER